MTIDIESAAAAVVHARATYGMTAETGEAIRRLAVALCDDDPRPMEPAAVDLSRLERIVADCAQPAAVGALEAVRWEGWSENSQEWIPIPRRMFDGFAKKPDEYIKVRALVPADAAQAQIAALTAKVAALRHDVAGLTEDKGRRESQQLSSLAELTAWIDGLGAKIHTYSLRGIALAAWSARDAALSAKTTELERDAATATARFARLYAIARRIRWTDYGVAHIDAGTDSAAAMGDLCEFLFADGLDAAIARHDSGGAR